MHGLFVGVGGGRSWYVTLGTCCVCNWKWNHKHTINLYCLNASVYYTIHILYYTYCIYIACLHCRFVKSIYVYVCMCVCVWHCSHVVTVPCSNQDCQANIASKEDWQAFGSNKNLVTKSCPHPFLNFIHHPNWCPIWGFRNDQRWAKICWSGSGPSVLMLGPYSLLFQGPMWVWLVGSIPV